MKSLWEEYRGKFRAMRVAFWVAWLFALVGWGLLGYVIIIAGGLK